MTGWRHTTRKIGGEPRQVRVRRVGEKEQVQLLHPRSSRKQRQGLFEPRRHPKLAEIVKTDTPANARKASQTLLRKYKSTRIRKEQTTIKKATVEAANIAGAQLQRKNLSSKERKQFTDIEQIYRRAAAQMK